MSSLCVFTSDKIEVDAAAIPKVVLLMGTRKILSSSLSVTKKWEIFLE